MKKEKVTSAIIEIFKYFILPIIATIVAAIILANYTKMKDFYIYFFRYFMVFIIIDFIIIYLIQRFMTPKSERNVYAATVVIFNNSLKAVLLNKREKTKKFHPGKYGIPGGRIEDNENVIDAAKRELHEETGINMENLYYINSYYDLKEKISMFVYAGKIDNPMNNYKSFTWFPLEKILEIEKDSTPNLKLAIFESKKKFETLGLIDKIDGIITCATANIFNNIKEIDGKKGWDQYLYENRIASIGTSIALLIIADSTLAYQNEIIYTVGKQLLDRMNVDGGWGKNSIKEGTISLAESTAFAILALLKCGFDKNNEKIQKAITWLKSNMSEEGSLGLNKFNANRRVFPTCLAILALYENNCDDKYVDKGCNWLYSTQLEDGGWPIGNFDSTRRYELESNVFTTSLAVYTLSYMGRMIKNEAAKTKAQKFLDKFLKRGQSIVDYAETEYVREQNDNKLYKLEATYDTTAILLLALCKMNMQYNYNEHILTNVIIEKFDTSKNWYHSLSPGKYPIWATYWNCLALKEIRIKLAKETILASI